MCIFCQIVNKEIPSTVVYENDHFLAFNDINPKAPVHLLAIPKAHFDSFEEFPSDQMQGLSTFIKEITAKMGLDKKGYRLITNIGEHGCQEVLHLHFHILGGKRLGDI